MVLASANYLSRMFIVIYKANRSFGGTVFVYGKVFLGAIKGHILFFLMAEVLFYTFNSLLINVLPCLFPWQWFVTHKSMMECAYACNPLLGLMAPCCRSRKWVNLPTCVGRWILHDW